MDEAAAAEEDVRAPPLPRADDALVRVFDQTAVDVAWDADAASPPRNPAPDLERNETGGLSSATPKTSRRSFLSSMSSCTVRGGGDDMGVRLGGGGNERGHAFWRDERDPWVVYNNRPTS